MLIDSAVRAVKGNLKDTKGLVKAMRKADFNSIRGKFTYNANHHPIQNFYLLRAIKGADGEVHTRIQKKVFDDHKNSCRLRTFALLALGMAPGAYRIVCGVL